MRFLHFAFGSSRNDNGEEEAFGSGRNDNGEEEAFETAVDMSKWMGILV